MFRWLCLLLFAATGGCTSFGPSSTTGTEKPGVVDWSCGQYMPVEDSTKWQFVPHDKPYYSIRKVTTRDIRSLASSGPHTLNLAGCDLVEGVIEEIARVETLKNLNLAAAAGDSDNIRTLAALELETLDLSGTKVSDDDLAAIAKISTLRTLRLNDSGVSNAGLRSLVSLTALERLEICSTAITEPEVAAFRRARPGVAVVDVVDPKEMLMSF